MEVSKENVEELILELTDELTTEELLALHQEHGQERTAEEEIITDAELKEMCRYWEFIGKQL